MLILASILFYLNVILCLISILSSNQNLFFISEAHLINNEYLSSNGLKVEHEGHKHHTSNHNHQHHNSNSSSHHKYGRAKKHRFLNSTTNEDENLIIETQSGKIRGVSFYIDEHFDENEKLTNKAARVDAWLGIPFAEKPVEKLRFKRPVPIKGWDGIKNTTELPNSCYQLPDLILKDFPGAEIWNPNTNVSEDCLYLNIWVPHPRPRNAAVMVWIYGGGFYSGSSTLKIYDPKIFVAETQVILVAMQYRLGIFGFLFLDHENAPGNQGLLDQNLALKWVHNNIQYFGGDNNRITIYGESAGSVSVSLHLLSKLSQNLFTNAIMQSGTAIADWATLTNAEAVNRAKEILENLDCKINDDNIEEAIECAQKVDPKVAMERSDEVFYSRATYGIAQFTFLPVVDRFFLHEEPIISVNRGHFKKCPILTGVNKDEGNWFFVYSFTNFRDFFHFNISQPPNINYRDFEEHIKQIFHFYPQYPNLASRLVLKAITNRYTNWNSVNDSFHNRENLDDAAGDFHFICPVVDFSNQYATNNQTVFLYHYTHRSSKHYWPEWLGVMHADEISFVFGEPLNNTLKYREEEKAFTRRLIKYWSNFAKYGDPNGYFNGTYLSHEEANKVFDENESMTKTLNETLPYWPKYKYAPNTSKERIHMVLDAYKTNLGNNLRAEYCGFWGNFMSELSIYESKCECSSGCLNSAIQMHNCFYYLIIMIINFKFLVYLITTVI